ncbi:MAG: hypothetical protein JXB38_02135 [Anaerolineales bacterium]|nr:hypothetical protein [Anaerolineales bacterium]
MQVSVLSDVEKAKIESEVKAAVDTVIAGCETLDMEMAFAPFLDAPEFRMMRADGSLCDYGTYIKENVDYLSTCASFDLTTVQTEIKVLSADLAIFSWVYNVVATLKNGEQDVFDSAGASFVFKKMDGAWKVIYYQESTQPPSHIPNSD